MYSLQTINKDGIIYETAPRLLEKFIFIAFTTRQKGKSLAPYNSLNMAFHVGDSKENVLANRQLTASAFDIESSKITCAKQVHGNKAAWIDKNMAGAGNADYRLALDSVDAMATDLTKTPLAMFFADCLPVVLVSTNPKLIAIAHAGYKGLLQDVIGKLVELVGQRAAVKNLWAFLGPAIGKCCYDVSAERLKLFSHKFPEVVGINDKSLDLRAVAEYQLISAGVLEENIISSQYCTCCNDDLFFSYRRQGITGRQAAIAMIL